MFANISLEEFDEVIGLFEKDGQKENTNYVDMGRLFIRGEENELMLRFNPMAKTMSIARIEFKNKRCGNGGKLLSILKNYAMEHGYQKIILESVFTKEASQFALKMGFRKKDGYNQYESETYYGDYVLVI